MTADTLFRARKEFPRLTPAAARAARLISVWRSLSPVGTVDLRVGPPPRAIVDPQTIWFSIDGEIGCARAPRTIVTGVLDTLDPAAASAPPAWRALLLELALADILTRLRTTCPALVAEIVLEPAEAESGERIALGLRVGEAVVRIELGPRAASHAADALATVAPDHDASLSVPITLRICRCEAAVTLAELRSLAEGDVVLADTLPDAELLLIAGDRLAWQAGWSGGRLTVSAARRQWEGSSMQENTALTGPETSLDELPIRLAFEIGRLEVSLAELQAVGPGYVFEVARAEDEAVDIVANGRRIGRGRVVDVGGALGVQVVRIGP